MIILTIITLVLFGYLLKFFNIVEEEHSKILSRIVVHLTMPATIFLTILKNLNSSEIFTFLKLPIVIIITFSFCGLLAYIVGNYLLKLDRESLGGFILVCMLANTGFLGYPVILGLFNTEGLVRAIFCDLGSVFVTMLLGSYVGIKFGCGEGKNIIVEMIKFPPLVVGILSIILVLFNFDLNYLPKFFLKSLEYLSSATVPLIMLSLGLSLSPRAIKYSIVLSFIVCIFRFILSPTSAYILSSIFNITGLEKKVLLVESSMPSAMMSFVLGSIYNLNIKLISSAIFITTLTSFLVIGFWEFVFR
ncbi:AEC family transporter [Methanocaldococcus indicus]|uniref:AEC family transporter n=1 Tax=Methanocaldococcus indicus TaxID=213231 RepID=UPI003C6CCD02